MEFDAVKLDMKGGVAVLTLNDPDTLNAFGASVLSGFRAAVDHMSTDSFEGRCLVLTGAGRGFSSGANLSEGLGPNATGQDVPLGRRLETQYHPILRRLRDLKIPVVTAVNGPAVGIGMSFALMGDYVLMARSAYFMLSFCRIGLVPDGGATWLLPRIIGLARARELALFGEKVPAEKALEWGLVNRVCDDENLMVDALEIAEKLTQGPTLAYGMMRKLFAESTTNTYEEQLTREQECQAAAGRSHDFVEGVTAFLEKRPPKFEGR